MSLLKHVRRGDQGLKDKFVIFYFKLWFNICIYIYYEVFGFKIWS